MFGWSFLEGVGAALVMPAIVALVASNFVKSERPRAYGIVTAGGAKAAWFKDSEGNVMAVIQSL
jgi:MFS family permease